MYLHLGQNTVIKTNEVIGIFDLDTCTISKHTKNYLKYNEKQKNVITITNDLPKSFIVLSNKKQKNNLVYISQISAATIKKRANKPYTDKDDF